MEKNCDGLAEHLKLRDRTGRKSARIANATTLGFLFVAALFAAPAGASGSSIGSFSLTGEVVASLKTSHEFTTTETVGGTSVKVPIYGCQVGQGGTNSDVINVPDGKVVLNGHSAKARSLEFTVPTDGKTDTVTAATSQLSFSLNVGKLSYLWVSDSGTITTKANGKSGKFSVTFEPSTSGTASGNSATKSLHVTGAWTTCRPWP